MKINNLYLITAFNNKLPLADNLRAHKDLLKFVNLWGVEFKETIIQYDNQLVIALIVDESMYRIAQRYIQEQIERSRFEEVGYDYY